MCLWLCQLSADNGSVLENSNRFRCNVSIYSSALVFNMMFICVLLSQYVFVSLLSRDSVYDVLRCICTHLQVRELNTLRRFHVENINECSPVDYDESMVNIQLHRCNVLCSTGQW